MKRTKSLLLALSLFLMLIANNASAQTGEFEYWYSFFEAIMGPAAVLTDEATDPGCKAMYMNTMSLSSRYGMYSLSGKNNKNHVAVALWQFDSPVSTQINEKIIDALSESLPLINKAYSDNVFIGFIGADGEHRLATNITPETNSIDWIAGTGSNLILTDNPKQFLSLYY